MLLVPVSQEKKNKSKDTAGKMNKQTAHTGRNHSQNICLTKDQYPRCKELFQLSNTKLDNLKEGAKDVNTLYKSIYMKQ
jgi:hypothetical protein